MSLEGGVVGDVLVGALDWRGVVFGVRQELAVFGLVLGLLGVRTVWGGLRVLLD